MFNFAPGIKIKLKDLSRKYKNSEFHQGQLIFYQGAKQKLWLKNGETFIEHVVTLAKILSVREASHHLTLVDCCQTFYSHIFSL